jgi:excisionase family DNA binding protein
MTFSTAKDVSEALNIPYSVICKMAARKQIPAIKTGKSWLFSLELVRKSLIEKMNEEQPAPRKKTPRINKMHSPIFSMKQEEKRRKLNEFLGMK